MQPAAPYAGNVVIGPHFSNCTSRTSLGQGVAYFRDTYSQRPVELQSSFYHSSSIDNNIMGSRHDDLNRSRGSLISPSAHAKKATPARPAHTSNSHITDSIGSNNNHNLGIAPSQVTEGSVGLLQATSSSTEPEAVTSEHFGTGTHSSRLSDAVAFRFYSNRRSSAGAASRQGGGHSETEKTGNEEPEGKEEGGRGETHVRLYRARPPANAATTRRAAAPPPVPFLNPALVLQKACYDDSTHNDPMTRSNDTAGNLSSNQSFCCCSNDSGNSSSLSRDDNDSSKSVNSCNHIPRDMHRDARHNDTVSTNYCMRDNDLAHCMTGRYAEEPIHEKVNSVFARAKSTVTHTSPSPLLPSPPSSSSLSSVAPTPALATAAEERQLMGAMVRLLAHQPLTRARQILNRLDEQSARARLASVNDEDSHRSTQVGPIDERDAVADLVTAITQERPARNKDSINVTHDDSTSSSANHHHHHHHRKMSVWTELESSTERNIVPKSHVQTSQKQMSEEIYAPLSSAVVPSPGCSTNAFTAVVMSPTWNTPDPHEGRSSDAHRQDKLSTSSNTSKCVTSSRPPCAQRVRVDGSPRLCPDERPAPSVSRCARGSHTRPAATHDSLSWSAAAKDSSMIDSNNNRSGSDIDGDSSNNDQAVGGDSQYAPIQQSHVVSCSSFAPGKDTERDKPRHETPIQQPPSCIARRVSASLLARLVGLRAADTTAAVVANAVSTSPPPSLSSASSSSPLLLLTRSHSNQLVTLASQVSDNIRPTSNAIRPDEDRLAKDEDGEGVVVCRKSKPDGSPQQTRDASRPRRTTNAPRNAGVCRHDGARCRRSSTSDSRGAHGKSDLATAHAEEEEDAKNDVHSSSCRACTRSATQGMRTKTAGKLAPPTVSSPHSVFSCSSSSPPSLAEEHIVMSPCHDDQHGWSTPPWASSHMRAGSRLHVTAAAQINHAVPIGMDNNGADNNNNTSFDTDVANDGGTNCLTTREMPKPREDAVHALDRYTMDESDTISSPATMATAEDTSRIVSSTNTAMTSTVTSPDAAAAAAQREHAHSELGLREAFLLPRCAVRASSELWMAGAHWTPEQATHSPTRQTALSGHRSFVASKQGSAAPGQDRRDFIAAAENGRAATDAAAAAAVATMTALASDGANGVAVASGWPGSTAQASTTAQPIFYPTPDALARLEESKLPPGAAAARRVFLENHPEMAVLATAHRSPPVRSHAAVTVTTTTTTAATAAAAAAATRFVRHRTCRTDSDTDNTSSRTETMASLTNHDEHHHGAGVRNLAPLSRRGGAVGGDGKCGRRGAGRCGLAGPYTRMHNCGIFHALGGNNTNAHGSNHNHRSTSQTRHSCKKTVYATYAPRPSRVTCVHGKGNSKNSGGANNHPMSEDNVHGEDKNVKPRHGNATLALVPTSSSYMIGKAHAKLPSSPVSGKRAGISFRRLVAHPRPGKVADLTAPPLLEATKPPLPPLADPSTVPSAVPRARGHDCRGWRPGRNVGMRRGCIGVGVG